MSQPKYRAGDANPANNDIEAGEDETLITQTKSALEVDKKNVWVVNDKHPCITRVTPFVSIEGGHVLVYGKSRGENIGFPQHCLLGPDYWCTFFTLSLIIGLSGLWFISVVKRHHIAVVGAGVFTGLTLLCSYAATAFSDPGIIKKQTIQELKNQKQPPNTILCRLCNIYRPYGARHCFDCNACIRDHDHHCPWSGQCIGGSLFIHIFYVIFSAVVPRS